MERRIIYGIAVRVFFATQQQDADHFVLEKVLQLDRCVLADHAAGSGAEQLQETGACDDIGADHVLIPTTTTTTTTTSFIAVLGLVVVGCVDHVQLQ